MGKPTGFLEFPRVDAALRAVGERVFDYREFELPVLRDELGRQSARCMDCGIPFCTEGCPLGNLIPDWNDNVFRNRPEDALSALHATNNFPEITGRICPAPCEAACVLGIHDVPVSIRQIEKSIADRGFEAGWVRSSPPRRSTGKSVAVIGSGPAGLASAQQLCRAGHAVTVYEKDDRAGGLLTYGIPDFKLEKSVVARRVAQLREEGVVFETGVNIGGNVPLGELRRRYDAICLCIGSREPRRLEIPGTGLPGVHPALDFLTQQNRRVAGDSVPSAEAILATDKHVVVIGGGDTGSDCIGTAHRQGAKSVTSLEILPKPPALRDPATPWPLWPYVLRSSSSHLEGGHREWSVLTEEIRGRDKVESLSCARASFVEGRFERIPQSEFEISADLVLCAMGFLHPERKGLLNGLGLKLDRRGNVVIDGNCMTSEPGIFAAGDCQRGQSLVVWAIADGRHAARSIDRFLMGQTELP